VEFGRLVDNQPLLDHFDGEPVILVRQGEQIFATGAICTHYRGPLAEGLVVGGRSSVRCVMRDSACVLAKPKARRHSIPCPSSMSGARTRWL